MSLQILGKWWMGYPRNAKPVFATDVGELITRCRCLAPLDPKPWIVYVRCACGGADGECEDCHGSGVFGAYGFRCTACGAELHKIPGTSKPYIVHAVALTHEDNQRLFGDIHQRLATLTADEFQLLVAEQLRNMGLVTHLVGHVYARDGGIDIIALPDPAACTFPFLVAVQCKYHSRQDRRTGEPEVRDFVGALASSPRMFHVGLLVTNTTFTASARWCADHHKAILRLRDIDDLERWLRDDFKNEHEWREIPTRIEVTRGIFVDIARP
jgi:hypothetical protein